ncbi:MAG: hypothetical protein IKB70_07475 [Bacilli bacterium]|nr:hypothetical protein [Bacilli bacterium]
MDLQVLKFKLKIMKLRKELIIISDKNITAEFKAISENLKFLKTKIEELDVRVK